LRTVLGMANSILIKRMMTSSGYTDYSVMVLV